MSGSHQSAALRGTQREATQKGFTLLEILIAMGLLTGLCLLLVDAFIVGNREVNRATAETAAISAAREVMEEIRSRPFDEVLVGLSTEQIQILSLPDALTATSGLGPDTGETRATFDDADDYHGLDESVISGYSRPFRRQATVEYVEENDMGGTSSSSPTFCKRVTVNVSTGLLRESVSLVSIVGY